MNKKFVKVIAKAYEDNRKIANEISRIGFDAYIQKKASATSWLGHAPIYLTKSGKISRRTLMGESCYWLMCDYLGKKRTHSYPKNIDSLFEEFDRLWIENKTHIQDLFLKKKYFDFN